MASPQEIVYRIKTVGTKSVEDLRTLIRQVRKELKDDPGSLAIKDRLVALQRELVVARQEQAAFNTEIRKSAKAFDEQAKVAKSTTDIRDNLVALRREAGLLTQAYEQLTRASKRSTEGIALKDRIKGIRSEINRDSISIGNTKDNIGNYQNILRQVGALQLFGGPLGSLAGQFTNLTYAIGGTSSVLAGPFGVAMAGAGDAVVALLSNTIQLAERFAAIEQTANFAANVFKDRFSAIKSLANDISGDVGRSVNQIIADFTRLGAPLSSIGFDSRETQLLSTELFKLAQILGSTGLGSFEDAVVGLSAALRGEFDPLERFGVKLNETLVNENLAARGLKDLTGTAKEQERAITVLELALSRSLDAQTAFSKAQPELSGALQVSTEDVNVFKKAVDDIGLSDKFPDIAEKIAVSAKKIGFVSGEAAGVITADLVAAIADGTKGFEGYGISISEAAVKQELAKQGITDFNSEQAKAAAGQIILRETILQSNVLFGQQQAEVGNTSEQLKSYKANVENLKDSFSRLGASLLPALKILTDFTVVVLGGFTASLTFAALSVFNFFDKIGFAITRVTANAKIKLLELQAFFGNESAGVQAKGLSAVLNQEVENRNKNFEGTFSKSARQTTEFFDPIFKTVGTKPSTQKLGASNLKVRDELTIDSNNSIADLKKDIKALKEEENLLRERGEQVKANQVALNRQLAESALNAKEQKLAKKKEADAKKVQTAADKAQAAADKAQRAAEKRAAEEDRKESAISSFEDELARDTIQNQKKVSDALAKAAIDSIENKYDKQIAEEKRGLERLAEERAAAKRDIGENAGLDKIEKEFGANSKELKDAREKVRLAILDIDNQYDELSIAAYQEYSKAIIKIEKDRNADLFEIEEKFRKAQADIRARRLESQSLDAEISAQEDINQQKNPKTAKGFNFFADSDIEAEEQAFERRRALRLAEQLEIQRQSNEIRAIMDRQKNGSIQLTKEEVAEKVAELEKLGIEAKQITLEMLQDEANLLDGSTTKWQNRAVRIIDIVSSLADSLGELFQGIADRELEEAGRAVDAKDQEIQEREQLANTLTGSQRQQALAAVAIAKKEKEQLLVIEEEKRQAANRAQKASKIAAAISQAALNVILAFGTGFTIADRLLNAKIAAALGVVNIGIIAAQPAFEGGVIGVGKKAKPVIGISGLISETPNIPTQQGGDNILAMLKNGETVLTKKHVVALGGPSVMKAINVPGYNTGGLVSPSVSFASPYIPPGVSVASGTSEVVSAVNGLSSLMQDQISAMDARIDRLTVINIADETQKALDDRNRVILRNKLS